MKYSFLTLLFSSLLLNIVAQDIPVSMRNEALYDFIEELAEEHYIVTNQVIKPYTLAQVNQWLGQAGTYYPEMSRRMQREWLFYTDNVLWQEQTDSLPLSNRIDGLSGANATFSIAPLGLYSAKKDVYFSGTPILKAQFLNNGTMHYHRSYGLEFNLKVKQISMYANLQDYAEDEVQDKPEYLLNRTGGVYKKLDYSEMRGGISYSNSWLKLALAKDNFSWGTHQNGANIISDRTPAFTYLKLTVKPLSWFEFNYIHGWLVSNIVDSTASYVLPNGNVRDVMHGKYVAANMFTFYPIPSFNISFGNSIIYSAANAKLPYLNPLMFYKSVDHTYNDTDGIGQNVGQNSQMFFDISYAGIKHCFFYYTMMVDELKIERWKSEDEHNFYSYKVGFRMSNLISDVAWGLEFTKTLPMTYQHDITTTDFTSNGYNMGHYLRDNARETYAFVRYRPMHKLSIELEYTVIDKGEEFEYIRGDQSLTRHPFLNPVRFTSRNWDLGIRYQLAYNMFFNVKLGQCQYSGDDVEIYGFPLSGDDNFRFSFGANIGF